MGQKISNCKKYFNKKLDIEKTNTDNWSSFLKI